MPPLDTAAPPSASADASEAAESILFVDDDQNILDALRRQFHNSFHIETAAGPEQGLAAIAEKGPFAVVVSDLRMPGMNGIQFLAAVRAQAPETVRVMLTGQADMADAIAAVNQGAIFRFLLKPSSAIILGKVIESALEQHRLIVAERQLTQQTLLGCVGVLAEVLSIVEPVAFSRTNRILRYVRELAGILELKDSWQLEAAAMLSQIGWISISSEIAEKMAANQPLSTEESQRFREHPGAAARMIERIPRLTTVAKIIEAQLGPSPGSGPVAALGDLQDPVFLGAALLQAAVEFDHRRAHGLSHAEALADMRLRKDRYPPEIVSAMARIGEIESADPVQNIPLKRLAPGMVLEQDIRGRNGMCLIGRGQQMTPALLQRLRGFSHTIDTDAAVAVRLPASQVIFSPAGTCPS